jgi:hypothetical protein
MSDMDEKRQDLKNEEERKRLITEIGNIKEKLDSFRYALNFEDFAEELFKTIDRQTKSINQLDAKMSEIVERMERLESRFNEGIKVTVSGTAGAGAISEAVEVAMTESTEEDESTTGDTIEPKDREKHEQELAELETKIGRLFEKENELEEMALNDPAGAEEYEEKARVAREMREELEVTKKKLKELLK